MRRVVLVAFVLIGLLTTGTADILVSQSISVESDFSITQTSEIWSYYNGGADTYGTSPAFADINNDSRMDVVFGGGYTYNEVMAFDAQNGTKLWNYTTADGAYSSPAIGDLNSDGRVEIVVFSRDGLVHALNGEDGSVCWTRMLAGGGVGYGASASVADTDDDEIMEVYIGSLDTHVYSLFGNNGTTRWAYKLNGGIEGTPAIGDLDGDGEEEIAIGSQNYVFCALNSEDGSVLWKHTGLPQTGHFYGTPCIVDIDGDGRNEVVTTRNDAVMYAFAGNNGSILWTRDMGYRAGPLSFGDLDGDGKLEIVVSQREYENIAPRYLYCLNAEDASTVWRKNIQYWAPGATTLADLTGDNKLDVLVGNGGYESGLTLLDGRTAEFIWEYNMNSAVTAPAVCDIDNDGTLEVAHASDYYNLYMIDADSAGFRRYWQGEGGVSDFTRKNCLDDVDFDYDMLSDEAEVALGLNPLNNDSDSDHMPDGWEVFHGFDNTVDDSAADADTDGLSNLEEFLHLTDPRSTDTDGDLMNDLYEVTYGLDPTADDSGEDLDGDTLSNYLEYQLGTAPNNTDSDFDLMPDGWECDNLLDPVVDDADDDVDSDFLVNLDEYYELSDPHDNDTDSDLLLDGVEVHTYSTSPISSDTDSDLMPDGWEVRYGLDPLINDALLDLDNDALLNLEEYQTGTSPANPDHDSDLLDDGLEVHQYLTDPLLYDTDSDTLGDGDELLTHGTNPLSSDTDSDELRDDFEILTYLTDPLDHDSDDDGLLDGPEVLTYSTDPLDTDSDDDQLTDYEEVVEYRTNPNEPDTDGDGLSDYEEIAEYFSDPRDEDSDNDGISDYDEIQAGSAATDYDGDGLSAAEEAELGTDPRNRDTDGDGLGDGWEIARGLDPLHWTYETGEAQENVNNFLFLGGTVFLLGLVVLSGMGIISKHKITKALRSRVLLIPAILLLLVFFSTVPMSVQGTSDPGSNSKSGSGTSLSLTTKDSPWWGNTVQVSVSLRLTIMFEYCDGTATVTSGLTTLGTIVFRFGRGGLIVTETETGSFGVPKGATVEVHVTYRHYDSLYDQNLGSVSFGLSISQSEEDGRNEDQKTWPAVRGQFLMLSVGAVVLAVLLPTRRVFDFVDRKRGTRRSGESAQYSEQHF